MATALQRHWVAGSLECHHRAVPEKPTQFDLVVKSLRLENDPQAWPISTSLRLWAKRHRNYRYVPEELLHIWELKVLVDE